MRQTLTISCWGRYDIVYETGTPPFHDGPSSEIYKKKIIHDVKHVKINEEKSGKDYIK